MCSANLFRSRAKLADELVVGDKAFAKIRGYSWYHVTQLRILTKFRWPCLIVTKTQQDKKKGWKYLIIYYEENSFSYISDTSKDSKLLPFEPNIGKLTPINQNALDLALKMRPDDPVREAILRKAELEGEEGEELEGGEEGEGGEPEGGEEGGEVEEEVQVGGSGRRDDKEVEELTMATTTTTENLTTST